MKSFLSRFGSGEKAQNLRAGGPLRAFDPLPSGTQDPGEKGVPLRGHGDGEVKPHCLGGLFTSWTRLPALMRKN